MYSDDPITPKRRWVAITVATLVMQFAYWPVLAGSVTTAVEGDEAVGSANGLLALGLALMPFVFLAAAFVSKHRNAPLAVMKGMGLFLVLGIPLGLLNPVIGLVAGYGSGAVATIRRDPTHELRPRQLAGVAAVVWVLVLLAVGATPFAIMTGSVLPFAAVGLADAVTDLREAPPAGASESG